MNIETIDHVNIETEDPERSARFYTKVLGMSSGNRPDFGRAGHWMYVNGQPVVHIITPDPDNAMLTGSKDAAISHFALRIENFEDARAHLISCDIDFEEIQIPGTPMRQLFFPDPDGVLIELLHIPEGARRQGPKPA
ncbi:MAG: VOC family protein [Alphaproteobacteria bacterium]|nr:VOC family protein [Alphaproteobacteria bacterium]